ncbi:MAG: NAD-dependent epimerase/dehydratase family protein [Vicinamibacteraceae bacterium]
MRVLVTGAGGFLGHAVTSALAQHGHEPIAFVRARAAAPLDVAATHVGDILDFDAVRSAAAGVDGVAHLAALTRVRDSYAEPLSYWRTNVGGTLNVLQALTEHEQANRLVLASTAAVYSARAPQPITEDAPTEPNNPYGASKLAADRAAADLAASGAIGAISLRAFNIAGAVNGVADRDLTRLIPKTLAVQAGRAAELVVNGDGSAVRDFVHVWDMAAAVVAALEACTPGAWQAYNVGSGRRTSVADVVAAAEDVTGRPVTVRHRPQANEPAVLLADSSHIRQDLGWQAKNSDLSQILADAWKALNRG